MKIVHVVDYYYPELGYQIFHLTRMMQKLGHEVVVVTSDRDSPVVFQGGAMAELLGSRLRGRADYFDGDGIRIRRLKAITEIGSTVLLRHLVATIHEEEPEILYVHGITTFSGVVCAIAKKSFGKARLAYQTYQIHAASMGNLELLYPAFKFAASPLILNSSDAFIAIANEAKDFAESEIGIPRNRIVVCEHGADPDLFKHSSTSREDLRARLGIDSDEFVCLYTGKILPYKGVHLIIQAIAELDRKYHDISVVVVGGGDSVYVEELRRLAKSLGIEQKLYLRKAVVHTELPQYYSASDVAVWPLSVTISALEAMSCQLPIIVSDVPAAAERVRYDNGMIIHKGSLAAIVEAIERLHNDRQLCLRMGNAGRAAIEDKLNWRSVSERILDAVK